MVQLENYPTEIQNLITDYPLHMIEVRRYENYEDFKTDLREVFGFLRKAEDKKELLQYINENQKAFQELSPDAYDMISVMGHSKELQQMKKRYQKDKGGKTDMCQAIKDLIEDGRLEGKKEGRRANMVSNIDSIMKNLRLNLNDACRAVGVTVEEYKKAKKAVESN